MQFSRKLTRFPKKMAQISPKSAEILQIYRFSKIGVVTFLTYKNLTFWSPAASKTKGQGMDWGQIQDPGQILERWWVGEVSNLLKIHKNYIISLKSSNFTKNLQKILENFDNWICFSRLLKMFDITQIYKNSLYFVKFQQFVFLYFDIFEMRNFRNCQYFYKVSKLLGNNKKRTYILDVLIYS